MAATCLLRPAAGSFLPRIAAAVRSSPFRVGNTSNVLSTNRRIISPPSSSRSFSVPASRCEEIRLYTSDHEYLHFPNRNSKRATIGITSYAASELGDIVYIELPALSSSLSAGDQLGTVESVKSASEILAPVSGVVVEVNSALADKPASLNPVTAEDVEEGGGWICKVEVEEQELGKAFGELMDAERYEGYKKGKSAN